MKASVSSISSDIEAFKHQAAITTARWKLKAFFDQPDGAANAIFLANGRAWLCSYTEFNLRTGVLR